MIEKIILGQPNYKPCFAGHETFPIKYGWIKKSYDAINATGNIALFNQKNAISIFGVGKNMVTAIKFWALQLRIFDKNGNIDIISNKMLADDGFDPWLENISTLWFYHWRLIYSGELTTYFWFFNYFNKIEFNRNSLLSEIESMLDSYGYKAPSSSTIKRDIDCFLRNYTPKSTKKDFTEDNIEGPLVELGLISHGANRDNFRINKGNHRSLSPYVFYYALLAFWEDNYPNSNTLSLRAIMNDPFSPGRIFCLTEEAVLTYVDQCETIKGLSWTETSGLRQFSISDKQVFLNKHDLINNFMG